VSAALEISERYIREVVQPLLEEFRPGLLSRAALAVAGTGSDAQGFDDGLSLDHHWGPRAQVILLDEDRDAFGEPLRDYLARRLPSSFYGHPVRLNRFHAVETSVDGVSGFFSRFLGRPDAPEEPVRWLEISETDLFHATSGRVFHDGPGEFTARRRRLAYYPDLVWKKRIADWCMYVTGQDAPYNLHRARIRGDAAACHMYFGMCLRRVFQLAHLLARRYAPHTKWLGRAFLALPGLGGKLGPAIDRLLLAEASWEERVHGLVAVNQELAGEIHRLELTGPPHIRPFDESLTDLTLYDSAAEIYLGLPPEYLKLSAKQLDCWEEMARQVLFDEGDYLKERARREGRP
jgi:hypothetical protein